jgi:Fe-S-cluster containining protein
MKKNKGHTKPNLSRRLHFPDEERRLSWLPILLDSYAIADTGVAIAVRNREKKERSTLACVRGCGNCCVSQTDLPLYPHEIVGIYWYASEKISGLTRDKLRSRLVESDLPGCPFLIDNVCVIHPMRPVGCRQFNVFTTPCLPGEDPYFTRRDDVLQPDEAYLDRAFAAVLPFYNLRAGGDPVAAIRMVRAQIMNLRSFKWMKLAVLMEKGTAAEYTPGKDRQGHHEAVRANNR